MVNGEMGQIMSCYGRKEKFPVSGLTSGLTTINRKKMTLPTQGRTLWAAKIVLPREVAEKRGEYTEKSSIDMKKPHIGAGKQPIEVEKQPYRSQRCPPTGRRRRGRNGRKSCDRSSAANRGCDRMR